MEPIPFRFAFQAGNFLLSNRRICGEELKFFLEKAMNNMIIDKGKVT